MTRFERLELSPAFDAHVHLRDGAMTETVIPTIKQGGVDTVYVMVCFLLKTLVSILFPS